MGTQPEAPVPLLPPVQITNVLEELRMQKGRVSAQGGSE